MSVCNFESVGIQCSQLVHLLQIICSFKKNIRCVCVYAHACVCACVPSCVCARVCACMCGYMLQFKSSSLCEQTRHAEYLTYLKLLGEKAGFNIDLDVIRPCSGKNVSLLALSLI